MRDRDLPVMALRSVSVKKLALAFVIGVATAALGLFLMNVFDAEWVGWILLLPWAVLGYLAPHPNIGTAEHPFYEGTPLDLPLAIIGVLLSPLLNAAIAYFVLKRMNRPRVDTNGE